MQNENSKSNSIYRASCECNSRGQESAQISTIIQRMYLYPFEKIKGRNGKISFDYIEERGTVRLQAKNSLNFTTLYSIDKHNRYFYGFPYKMPIYSSQNRANPFYHNKNDLFLFVVHQGGCGKVPPIIDLIIIENGFPQRQSLFRKLAKGGFNRFLNALDDLPDIREDRKISVCLSFSFEPYV